MYCKKCGTEQKEGQKFCPKCGTQFVEMVKHSKDKSSEELTETKEQRGEIVEPVDNERIREREPQMKAAGVHSSSSGGDKDADTGIWSNWKTWAIVLCVFFMFKLCGGNGGSSSIDTDALEIRLIGKYHIDNPHITSVEKVNDDPPTFRFEYDYEDRSSGLRQHRSGHCTLYEDGDFKDIY